MSVSNLGQDTGLLSFLRSSEVVLHNSFLPSVSPKVHNSTPSILVARYLRALLTVENTHAGGQLGVTQTGKRVDNPQSVFSISSFSFCTLIRLGDVLRPL